MKSLGQQTSKFRFQKSRPSHSTARTRNYSLYNQKISQNLRLLHSFLCFFLLFFFFSSFFSFLSQHTEISQVQNSSPTLSLSFKLSLSSPLAFTILTEFPPRIQREVLLFFPSFGFYIRPLYSSSFLSFSHAFSSGKQPLNLKTNTPQ